MIKVLFVCLGNICRSPMAEGVFRHLVESRNLTQKLACDSCGTASYHIGELPDSRMRETAIKHGIVLNHRARQFASSDFEQFDYIVAMDQSNYYDILAQQPQHDDSSAEVVLMRQFDSKGKGQEVPDPYYGALQGFEEVFEILKRSNEHFLDYVVEQHKLS